MGLFRPNIGRMAAHADVAGLIRLLGHSEAAIRAEAAAALGQLGAREAAEPLGRVLASETDPAVAQGAATALVLLDSAGSAVLARTVHGNDAGPTGIEAAVDALWLTGSKPLDAALTESLIDFSRSSPLRHKRARALQKLVASSEADLSSLLDEALASDSAEVRAVAVDAVVARCGLVPHNRSRLPGVERAPDPIQMPQPEAGAADLPHPSIPASLQARCAVSDQRFDWAVTLGSVAVEPLSWLATTAYGRDQPRYLDRAVRSLAAIGDPASAAVLDGLVDLALSNREEAKAVKLVGILAECGVPRAHDHLDRIDPSPGPGHVRTTVGALIRSGGTAAVAPIVAALRAGDLDGDAALRREAVRHLGVIGTDDCVEGLSIALRDPDSAIVAAAAHGLVEMSGDLARAALGRECDRVERELASARARWEPWKDWDSQRVYDEDDSPGHSTYRMEMEEREALSAALRHLEEMQRVLQEAQGIGPAPHSAD